MSPEPTPTTGESEDELPPYHIEAARSSRSKCRSCRHKIDKDGLRLGILFEGPYGTGYLWHHLNCAAKRRFEDVEAAYGERAWDEGLEVPALEELAQLRQKAEEAKAKRRDPPYLEVAPSARSKCKHCGEGIPKDSMRVVLAREVAFGNQVRSTAINVHPRCVGAELRAEDCLTELDGFEVLLRANSKDLGPEKVEATLAAIGPLE